MSFAVMPPVSPPRALAMKQKLEYFVVLFLSLEAAALCFLAFGPFLCIKLGVGTTSPVGFLLSTASLAIVLSSIATLTLSWLKTWIQRAIPFAAACLISRC